MIGSTELPELENLPKRSFRDGDTKKQRSLGRAAKFTLCDGFKHHYRPPRILTAHKTLVD